MKNVMRGVVVILSMFPIILNGQVRQEHCSTPTPESRIPVDVDKLRRERTRSIVLPEVVEVFVHFTTDNTGTLGTVSIDTFMARLQNTKVLFYPHNICFLFVGSQIIQSSDLDNHRIFGSGPENNEQGEVIPYVKAGMLNVFVHHVLMFGDITGGGNAYNIPNNYLSIDDDALSQTCCVGTLAHEVGHCLGLYHTFEWTWGSGNQNQVREKVERVGTCANCVTEGDLLCDTPADPHELASFSGMDTFYLLVWENITNCVFDTIVMDNCGDQYDPDETNMMSYFPDSCHTNFTTDQGLRALSFLNGSLSELVAPENQTVDHTATYTAGEYFHTAEHVLTYSSSNLNYTADAILWSAAGNSVHVLPGTTFSPGTGFTVLSAQSTCD